MWRDIKDYEGLYEINENAVVRRVEGKGIDGRKVTTHVVVSSKTRKGTRYIALWKNGRKIPQSAPWWQMLPSDMRLVYLSARKWRSIGGRFIMPCCRCGC